MTRCVRSARHLILREARFCQHLRRQPLSSSCGEGADAEEWGDAVGFQQLWDQFLDRASGKTSLAPAYVGNDSLVGCIWRTLTAAPLVAVLVSPTDDRAAWLAAGVIHGSAQLSGTP